MRVSVPSAAAVTIAVLAMALPAGCGGDDDSDSGDNGGATATQTETAATETAPETETETTAAADGEAAFDDAGCADCHTLAAAGATGQVGPDLDETDLDVAQVEQQVREGGGGMPSFEGQLSEDEIAAVAEFVVQSSQQ
jgi:mono/diheme cytochrome c family protein